MTPGIRPLGTDHNDQSRVADVSQALQMGASRLVIGRAITQSSNPSDTFKRICEQIEEFI